MPQSGSTQAAFLVEEAGAGARLSLPQGVMSFRISAVKGRSAVWVAQLAFGSKIALKDLMLSVFVAFATNK